MRSIINRALARFDLALVNPSQWSNEANMVSTITTLNEIIKQLENDKLELGDKLLAMSRENEMPRCDAPFLHHQFDQHKKIRELQAKVQNLRCRVTYWKQKAGK